MMTRMTTNQRWQHLILPDELYRAGDHWFRSNFRTRGLPMVAGMSERLRSITHRVPE